jgi:cell division protein FtsN
MSRDYKSRANPAPPKKPEKQTAGWLWFTTGMMVGLFLAGLAWLKLGPSVGGVAAPQAATSKAASPAKVTEPKREEKPLPPKPRFDFYTLLPEMEVLVPESEEDVPESPAKADEPASAATAYILQMGSFHKHEDADRLKANLALLGVEAEIQKVNINNKDTYHRVRSGPYSSRKQVDEVRARLLQNNISSLLIKLKG